MQWLIDMIIEAIGVPPCYIDRGDPPAVDFTFGPADADSLWHALDLSAIVPAGATAVALAVLIVAEVPTATIRFRKNGNVNDSNATRVITQVAWLPNINDCVVACDTDRIIDRYIYSEPIITITVTVKGWWL